MGAAWDALWGTVRHPRRTFEAMEADAQPAMKGLVALLVVCAAYTLILIAFLVAGYEAAAPSILGVSTTAQYQVQVWYQAPLFIVVTAATAVLLTGLAVLAGGRARFRVALGRVALATAVPFALTTMVVESAVAVLMLVGVLEPESLLGWLTGQGAWFAATYQTAGLAWLVALVVLAVHVTLRRGWAVAVGASIPVLILYGLPVALLIR